MTSTTIDTGHDITTLINVFTVTSETQQPLVDLLVDATDKVMRHRPGFVSATIHTSRRRHPRRQLRPVAQPRGLPSHAG